jgi:hypothetical protein
MTLATCSQDAQGCSYQSSTLACTTSVGHAQPVCVGSGCTFACDTGYAACGGACVNEQTDNGNCGACGKVCSGACASGQCIPVGSIPNVMFVTSTTFTGNLGGLAGADVQCNARAKAAALSGTFVAFLSTSAVTAGSRLGSAQGWVRTDGRPFANTVADLLAGNTLYPPVLDELGHLQIDIVATGTTFGNVAARSCNDWTSTSATSAKFDGGWTSLSNISFYDGASTDCATPFRIYCFETSRLAIVNAVAPAPHRTAFLSKTLFSSGAGVAAADAVCASDAASVGLPGTFAALLPTAGASAISRFSLMGAPWARLDGVLVADTAAQIVTSPGAHIDVVSDGTHAGPYDAANATGWIGADRIDTPSPAASTCADWTSTSGMGKAFRLANSAFAWPTAAGGWSNTTASCSGSLHLFCLEQ